MPIFRYHDLSDAERALPASPDADTGIRTALALSGLDEATMRGIRLSPVGVFRYQDIAEAEAARYQYAIQQLRDADAKRSNTPRS